jgi:hypothetical protein
VPFGLGNAFQTRGTFSAVPSLIGDLVEQAPFDPHPGVADCSGPNGSAFAHHRVREQAHLQRPFDAIQNLVNRLYP